MTDTPPPKRLRRTSASQRRGWWPGWIWGVPIAAVGIVLWLTARALSNSGTDIHVVFDKAAGMTADSTQVTYLGLQVGKLTDIHLATDGRHMDTTLNIDDSVKKYLTSGTRFYLEGANISLSNPQSLKALIAGPTIVMVPGEGKPARQFTGIDGNPPARLHDAVTYRLRFQGAAGKLKVGAPVVLRGFTVGDVTGVELQIDAHSGAIHTPVTIALDPSRFHVIAGDSGRGGRKLGLDAVLDTLVAHGLRAELSQSPPIVGSARITLKMIADAEPAKLPASGGTREIPTVSGDGLMRQVDALPIQAIGNNIETITNRLKALTTSPKIEHSIDQLDRTLTALNHTMRQARPPLLATLRSLHRTVQQTGPQVTATVRALRKTATQIDATARAARDLTGVSPAAPDGNLRQTLDELTRSARAIRSLADYLDQHPEALIRGR